MCAPRATTTWQDARLITIRLLPTTTSRWTRTSSKKRCGRHWPTAFLRSSASRSISQWGGHYAHNTVDHNVIVGPHHEVGNFVFVNGFSGPWFAAVPGHGRGVAELITYGEYRDLDLAPLGYDRIVRGEPFIETAII